jgi:hypothetical protein
LRIQLKALQELAAAEAAEAAAAAEYETVSLRNEADISGYVVAQASEVRASLYALAVTEEQHAAAEADGWLAVAAALGCSADHIAAIQCS